MAKYLSYDGLGKVWTKIKTNFVSSLGVSGNYLTWTKNGTVNNITVPFSTTSSKLGTSSVGNIQRPIYLNSGTPTVSTPGEAFLSWGGQNLAGTYSPLDAALIDYLGPNRLAFISGEKVSIEYSRDSGTTWTDYEATNAQKTILFTPARSQGASFVIGKSTASNISNANCRLKVSIVTNGASVYTTLNKFVIYVSTNGSSGCYVTIRARTQQNLESNTDTWTTFAEEVGINGWSGWNVINISGLTTYGNTKGSQYGQIEFIFGCTGHGSSSYYGLQVLRILGFGGMGWTTPSNMATHKHLYDWDADQNAKFPGSIYPQANNTKDLGGTSWRWANLYCTNINASGNLIVGGNFRVLNNGGDAYAKLLVYPSSPYGIVFNSASNGTISIQSQRESNNSETFPLILNPNGGNVGIGTSSPSQKLDVSGNVKAASFIKSGGTSSQFLKADGSVDETQYSPASHEHTKIKYVDNRAVAVTPTDAVAVNGVQLDFKSASVGGLGSSGYNGILTLDPYSDVSGGYPIQLGWNTAVDGNNTKDICIRTAKSGTEWNSWRVLADREITTAEINNICV